ncbi:MAG TPA: hypothetical protein VMT82_10490 [candidate division Zixibacteria bacterium]|nr:hypothetical protein [candidate division Zixibacteria bacterium]
MVSRCCVLILTLFVAPLLGAQNPSQSAPGSPQTATGPVSSTARLRAARTIYLREKGRGSHVPFDIISAAFSSWPRFVVVERPEDAELLVDIYGPDDATTLSVQGPLSGSSSYENSAETRNRMQDRASPSTPSRDTVGDPSIRMAVRDARNGFPLWTGKELPKGAVKQRSKEDNMVGAAQKLFYRFHDVVEPPEPETPEKK